MTAYVQTETEDEARIYKIYEKEKYVLVENEDKKDGICRIVATVLGENSQDEGIMFIRCADGGQMTRLEICEPTDIYANLMQFRGNCIKRPETEIRCFFWENTQNIKPIDEFVIIE